MSDNQFAQQPRLPDPIFHIETNKIKPNPFQPRRVFDEDALHELANSIREFGILHPLVVTKLETPTEHGTEVEYQLISGERRLMASRLAGLERVPAIIKSVPSDRERLELAIIENIQRENLNPIETARAYAKLQDQFGLTQREVAVRVGKSREAVANAIRLLNLPTEIQDAVSHGKINESQARLLLMLSDIKEQKTLFEDLMLNNLSVRQLRSRIAAKKAETAAGEAPVPAMPDPEMNHIEEQLREALGTKVRVQKEGTGGKLTINFYSPEELQAIIDKLTKTKEAAEAAALAEAPQAAEFLPMEEPAAPLHELPDLSEQKPDFTV
ncbi:MAG: ParB/RepB/Spo0J family partition protein [Patescibacteria group bacterium]|nr:ParB/RepB/Spo0J family partition protein [Patescibacteria group bacterium]